MLHDDALAGPWKRLRADAARVPCLTYERERELLSRSKSDDKQALGELVSSHLRLVVDAASRYERRWLQPEDLVSEGCIGLIEAIQRFDLGQRARLSTYARWWIRARVREYARGNRNLVRRPDSRAGRVASAHLSATECRLGQQLGRAATRAELAAAMQVSESDVSTILSSFRLSDLSLTRGGVGHQVEPRDDRSGPEARLEELEQARELSARVQACVATFAERDRTIIRAHFLEEDAISLSDLGQTLGVTRQRVSQIVTRLRRTLRKELQAMAS